MQSIMLIGKFLILSLSLMILTIIGTHFASKLDKNNKFRKWWSRNICDIDNNYN